MLHPFCSESWEKFAPRHFLLRKCNPKVLGLVCKWSPLEEGKHFKTAWLPFHSLAASQVLGVEIWLSVFNMN